MKTFRQFIEMNQDKIDQVLDYLDPQKLPFNNLFHGKTRILIPYTPEVPAPIIDVIKTLGQQHQKNYQIDPINQKVNYEGKNERGTFQRSENIGRFLQKHSPALMDLYNRGAGTYDIVISRNPIDVLRMSDFEHIQSCHSQGGDYFDCAVQEAKGHGPIAFLIRKQDAKNLNLEAPEIFQDKERNIEGITPVARIRFRRYINKAENYELAIPQGAVYGSFDNDGFRNSVLSWAKEKQPVKNPNMQDFVRKGGKYSEDEDQDLFNDFFGNDYKRSGLENVPYEKDLPDYLALVEIVKAFRNNFNSFRGIKTIITDPDKNKPNFPFTVTPIITFKFNEPFIKPLDEPILKEIVETANIKSCQLFAEKVENITDSSFDVYYHTLHANNQTVDKVRELSGNIFNATAYKHPVSIALHHLLKDNNYLKVAYGVRTQNFHQQIENKRIYFRSDPILLGNSIPNLDLTELPLIKMLDGYIMPGTIMYYNVKFFAYNDNHHVYAMLKFITHEKEIEQDERFIRNIDQAFSHIKAQAPKYFQMLIKHPQ